jgi:hypothetical protein
MKRLGTLLPLGVAMAAPVRADDSLLRVQAPDYLAGMSWLLREAKPGEEDQMYLFLPPVNRVRRVIGDAGYDSISPNSNQVIHS